MTSPRYHVVNTETGLRDGTFAVRKYAEQAKRAWKHQYRNLTWEILELTKDNCQLTDALDASRNTKQLKALNHNGARP